MTDRRRKRPPLRRCVSCGGDCYGWSESSRCGSCTATLRSLGPAELEPGGLAEETRRRRLERQLEIEREIARAAS